MSYSHSLKPDLPVTHSSPFSTWFSVLFFFLVPDMLPVLELLVPGFGRPVLLCRGQDALGLWDGGIHMRWLWSIPPTQV